VPTLRKMIVDFSKIKYRDKKEQELLVGEEEYSLLQRPEISAVLNKNIIKTTKKDLLNQQIAEAIEESFKKIKKVDFKVLAKGIYQELVDHLAVNFGFNIDISEMARTMIGSPEERWMYLLRETERNHHGSDSMKIAQIAEKLGCSRRSLELDVKRITETGFKLLGQKIQLVDEDNSVLNMKSTPHPIILMQNISQILVILEGLRAMEKNQAFKEFADHTAMNIWNQLTEYAQNKVLDALELMGQDAELTWYFQLRDSSKNVNRFLSEAKMSESNPLSRLMYLGKNRMPFNITYLNDQGERTELYDCVVRFFNPVVSELRVTTPQGEFEIQGANIVEIEVLT